jgi:hypothetical protein
VSHLYNLLLRQFIKLARIYYVYYVFIIRVNLLLTVTYFTAAQYSRYAQV